MPGAPEATNRIPSASVTEPEPLETAQVRYRTSKTNKRIAYLIGIEADICIDGPTLKAPLQHVTSSSSDERTPRGQRKDEQQAATYLTTRLPVNEGPASASV